MDETTRKGTALEAIVVIIFFFAILSLILYKFGTNKESVVNETIAESEQINNLSDFGVEGSEEEVYTKYLKQIYDTQKENENKSDTEVKIEKIIENFQDELSTRTEIPYQVVLLKNVSEKFSTKNYANNFEIIYSDFLKKGGTSEGNIFVSQITDDGKLLPLSDYDKATILRLSVEYKNFAEKLQNLSTPLVLQKRAEEMITNALNISYILEKIVDESDQKIYQLWINKYGENISAIIALRYGLHQN